MIVRPDWTLSRPTSSIDLSRNVHYDSVLNQLVSRKLSELTDVNCYPNDYELYESISNYYRIPINNLALGFGATDILDRIIRSLDYKCLYIVVPTFEMVEVFCNLANKNYKCVTPDQIKQISDIDSMLYIANPNGVTGEVHNVSDLCSRFKYVILDEVYADFYPKFSLLSDAPDNTIIVKSLSKSLGLAGFRVGFSKASNQITKYIQQLRMNYVTHSVSTKIIPKIIDQTPDVIHRMLASKQVLESMHKTKPSYGNFVLFEEPNIFTSTFGYKLCDGFYRMSLADLNTLYGHINIAAGAKPGR